MAPQIQYSLNYFQIRARGESIRWILKAANVPFKDNYIPRIDWPKKKAIYEWGVIPVLEVNGVELNQSAVICRYLGRNHGLAPSDNFQEARMEAVAESVHELMSNLGACYFARLRKEMDQVTVKMDIFKTNLNAVLDRLEKLISNKGWIISDTMTWCDIYIGAYLDLFDVYLPEVINEHSKCKQLLENTRNVPGIKDHIETRPPLHEFESAF